MLIYPGEMKPPPPLIKLKFTEPYYTRTVLPIEECRHTEIPKADGPPSTNQAYMYRALLHQDSITNSRMQAYWDTQSRQTPSPAPNTKLHLVVKRRMRSYFQMKCTLRWDIHQHSELIISHANVWQPLPKAENCFIFLQFFHYLYTLFYYFYQLFVCIKVLVSYLKLYKCELRGFTTVLQYFKEEGNESEW